MRAEPRQDLGSAPPAERVTPLEIDGLLSRAYGEYHALRLVSYTGWQADLGDEEVAQIQDLIRDLANALVAQAAVSERLVDSPSAQGVHRAGWAGPLPGRSASVSRDLPRSETDALTRSESPSGAGATPKSGGGRFGCTCSDYLLPVASYEEWDAECPRCGHVTTMSTDPGPRSLAGDSGDTGAEVVVPGRGPVLSGEAQTRSAAPGRGAIPE